MSNSWQEDATNREFRERQMGQVSILWLLALMLRERRLILSVTAIGLIGGLVIALVRAPTYTTKFSFVPQVAQDPSRAGLAS